MTSNSLHFMIFAHKKKLKLHGGDANSKIDFLSISDLWIKELSVMSNL